MKGEGIGINCISLALSVAAKESMQNAKKCEGKSVRVGSLKRMNAKWLQLENLKVAPLLSHNYE